MHISTNDGSTVNERNFDELSGYTEEQLLRFAGFFGNRHEIKDLTIKGTYPNVEVVIKTEDIMLSRMIMFEAQEVKNILVISQHKRNRTGFNLVATQVKHLKPEGFKKMHCNASGNWQSIGKYNGFITWGKLGYLMIDEIDRNNFNSIKAKHPELQTLTFHEFLMNEKGSEIWAKNGESWDGYFEFGDNSPSLTQFETYRLARGLSYPS